MLNSMQALHKIECYTSGNTELHLTCCFNKEYIDKYVNKEYVNQEPTASYFPNIFFCLSGKVFHLSHGLLR